jgi:hypothetical protein
MFGQPNSSWGKSQSSFSSWGKQPEPKKQEAFSWGKQPEPKKQEAFSWGKQPEPKKQEAFSWGKQPEPKKQEAFSWGKQPESKKQEAFSWGKQPESKKQEAFSQPTFSQPTFSQPTVPTTIEIPDRGFLEDMATPYGHRPYTHPQVTHRPQSGFRTPPSKPHPIRLRRCHSPPAMVEQQDLIPVTPVRRLMIERR